MRSIIPNSYECLDGLVYDQVNDHLTETVMTNLDHRVFGVEPRVDAVIASAVAAIFADLDFRPDTPTHAGKPAQPKRNP